MSERSRKRRSPSVTSPRGFAKLSAESLRMTSPVSRRAAFTRSSSSRIRTESSSMPQICARLTPSVASRGRWMRCSMSRSMSSSGVPSATVTANHMIGMSPSSLDQMRMRSTESGISGRALSMRSRSSALASWRSPELLNWTRRRTLPWRHVV